MKAIHIISCCLLALAIAISCVRRETTPLQPAKVDNLETIYFLSGDTYYDPFQDIVDEASGVRWTDDEWNLITAVEHGEG